jgi:subtilisin family serine protease
MRRVFGALIAAPLGAALVAHPVGAGTKDPYLAKQWGLEKIRAEGAWKVSTGKGALIAVVDTGVDLKHPDLARKLVVRPDADMVDPKGADGALDENGHGTHVAGIAGAITNNGVGVAGTAPGAKILPVRVLDAEGSGATDQVADGIRYAADHGADVINLSLGFLSGVGEVVNLLGDLDPVHEAVDHAHSKGAVVIAAAGNDAFPLCAQPASHPNVLCVGATDSRDLKSWFSNFDVTMSRRFIVAPGGESLTCDGDVFSTYLRSAESACSEEPGYDALAGTSMATPFVSGVAALLSSKGLGNDEIVDCLVANSDDLGPPGWDPLYGHGRLNARKAVTNC